MKIFVLEYIRNNFGRRGPSRLLLAGFELAALGLFAFAVVQILPQHFSRTAPLAVRFATSGCPGDVNGDGQRNIRDVVLIQAHILGKQLLAGVALDAADVNGDGRVDVLDVVRLLQHVTKRKLLDDCRALGNPVPLVSSISPASVTAGGAAFTLTVNGTNFINGSTVQWNGSNRPTTFVSSAKLTAAISVTDIAVDDSVSVVVSNPAPGGGLSNVQTFIVNPNPVLPPLGPGIRYIAPKKGKTGSQFMLVGRGFDPVASKNTVIFSRPEGDVAASVISATETSIVGTVPATLQAKVYAVTVTVNGTKTNAVGYEASTEAASLAIRPSMAFLLMSPGSGKETLVIGGGTPPYKLKPLSAEDQPKAKVELKGNVLDVTGLDPGKFGVADVSIGVSDSAPSPAAASASVRVQIPKFEPTFDIVPHTLLAGSSPGFTIKIGTSYGDMRLLKTKIKFDKIRSDFSSLKRSEIGVTEEDGPDFGLMQLTKIESASKARFQVTRIADGSSERIGTGTLEPGTLTLVNEPAPAPEAVFGTSIDIKIILGDGLFQLPDAGGESFTATATFTSVTVFEGKNIPLTKVATKTFKTVAPPPGASRITRLLPIHGEVGREVRIVGSGFSSAAANNKVTFAAPDGTRVEASIRSASSDQLVVFVPFGSVSGPLRVTVNNLDSNDYDFRVLFRPEAYVAFPQFKANTPVGPLLVVRQQADEINLASVKVILDDGKVNVAGLDKNKSAGTASIVGSSGNVDPYLVVYGGQEPTGAQRHFFDLKQSLETGSFKARVFLSDNSVGKGVTLEVTRGQSFSLLGSTLTIQFEKGVYLTPAAAGTNVNTRVEVRSVQWIYYPQSEMLVTYAGEARTQ